MKHRLSDRVDPDTTVEFVIAPQTQPRVSTMTFVFWFAVAGFGLELIAIAIVLKLLGVW